MAVTTSSGNGYALYNGNKLPNIDSVWTGEVKETHPYALIADYSAVSTGMYVACFSAGGFAPTDGVPAGAFDTVGVYVVYELQDKSWVLLGSGDESTAMTIIGDGAPSIWTSHDILNTDNTVYLAASDPIPLDGKTVIEWDGDMTGLDVGTYISEGADSGYSLYKVADYVPMRNGDVFAVWFVERAGAEIIGADDYYEAEFGAGGRCHSHLIISAPAGMYTPTVGTLTATITLPSDGVYMYSSDDGQARTTLYAYPTSGEGGDTYDEKEFLSGLVMGLCSKGNPTFTASDVFGKGYLVGAELRSKRAGRVPVAYLYNGVRLPKLPATTEDAPNGFIVVSSASGEAVYYARYASSKKKVNVDGAVILLQYDYVLQNGTWVSGTNTVAGTLMWANYDVYYSDSVEAVGGTLYLAASDPVPVYE